MFRSPAARVAATVVAIILVLAVLRFGPWLKSGPASAPVANNASASASNNSGDAAARQSMAVGYLPVTCHLTCPVTDYASRTTRTGTEFDATRFSDFPTITDTLKAGKIGAAFLTVPLVMKMREQGVPVKICCLGHRDGSEIVVRKSLAGTSLRDMKGTTFAIPGPYSNENFLLRKLIQEQGLQPTDIKIVVVPPPDMPASLGNKSIDGFVVAEPFCSKAELDGTGRVLYYAKDIWPHYISCALVVNEDTIKQHPDQVRDLVRGIVGSGEWAETHREDAAKLVAPYFRQNPKLLNYVLTHPRDRVTYRMLTPGDAEMQHIEDIGLELGLLKKSTPMSELMDKDFIPREIEPAIIDMAKVGTLPVVGQK